MRNCKVIREVLTHFQFQRSDINILLIIRDKKKIIFRIRFRFKYLQDFSRDSAVESQKLRRNIKIHRIESRYLNKLPLSVHCAKSQNIQSIEIMPRHLFLAFLQTMLLIALQPFLLTVRLESNCNLQKSQKGRQHTNHKLFRKAIFE